MKKPTLNKIEKLAKGFKDVKAFEFTEYDFTLTVNQYLPIQKKKELVEDVVLRCVVEDDGLQYIHTYISHIAKSCAIIRFYTNIELGEDNFDSYDMLNRIPLIYEQALGMIPENELKEINMMIDKFVEDMKFNQMYSGSVETIIKQALDKLIKMIPDEKKMKDLMSELQTSFNGLDPSKLNFVQDFIKANNGVEPDGGSKDL